MAMSVAGAHSITAVYSNDPNLANSTSGVLTQTVVNPNLATALVATLSSPSNVTFQTAFSVAVTAVNGWGNGVSTYNSQVSISLASAPANGTLRGTLSGSFSGGGILFNNLVATKAGTYVLLFTSGSLKTELTIIVGGRQT